MLLFSFLLLEFKRAVKRLCYLNILNGKNSCLNVCYRPAESKLKRGGWGAGRTTLFQIQALLLRSRLCAGISKRKSYPSFFGFSFIGITSMLLEKIFLKSN